MFIFKLIALIGLLYIIKIICETIDDVVKSRDLTVVDMREVDV